MPDGMDRQADWGLSNRQTNPIENSKHWTDGDNLDGIYTQKSMSINRYMQSATLTNVNAQLTTWSEILARQPTNGTNQQFLFVMITQSMLR